MVRDHFDLKKGKKYLGSIDVWKSTSYYPLFYFPSHEMSIYEVVTTTTKCPFREVRANRQTSGFPSAGARLNYSIYVGSKISSFIDVFKVSKFESKKFEVLFEFKIKYKVKTFFFTFEKFLCSTDRWGKHGTWCSNGVWTFHGSPLRITHYSTKCQSMK